MPPSDHHMATPPPPTRPVDPGEPSNRWPWALVLGVIVIAIAVGFFLYNQQRTVTISVEGTPTVNPLARAGTASPGPPPTLVPPTLPASATLAPTATPVPPSPTPLPVTPTPGPPPPAPTQPPVAAAPTQPPVAAAPPTQPAAPAPTAAAAPPQPTPATPIAPPSPVAAATPTPQFGQLANSGGLGNTRADLDAAYGAPAGETPEHLVVYRKNNVEYHVGFVPDPNGRAALLVELPPQGAQSFALDQAMAEVRKLLPKDAQPPNPPPEGNERFVVERYTSQSLAQALPAEAFTANKGQPGQFLAVYVRDAQQQARITRIIIGPGNDPQALVDQGR
jgi:hypothetical protein